MSIVCGFTYSSWIIDISTCPSIYYPRWPSPFTPIWRTKTSSNDVVVPCWLSFCMCSTTCSTPSTGFLCLPISSTINHFFCCETFYTCSSTFAFGVSYPLPLKFCGFSSCYSYVATLHSTSSTSCTRLDGSKLSGLWYIKVGKAFLKVDKRFFILPMHNQIFLHNFLNYAYANSHHSSSSALESSMYCLTRNIK